MVAEQVAAAQIDARLAARDDAASGISVTRSGGPALLAVMTGRLSIDVELTDGALTSYAACRSSGAEAVVTTAPDELIVSLERPAFGTVIPIEVGLRAASDAAGWRLQVDTVAVAGMILPADRALALLSRSGGDEGSGNDLSAQLADGIPLPSHGGVTVTGVRIRPGATVITAEVAVNGAGTAGAGAVTGLLSCDGEDHDR